LAIGRRHRRPIATGTLHSLELARRDDQLEHLADPLDLASIVQIEVAALLGETDQRLLGPLGNLERADQIEAAIHELLWRERALLVEPVDDLLDTWLGA
jgi:hypothetical protein